MRKKTWRNKKFLSVLGILSALFLLGFLILWKPIGAKVLSRNAYHAFRVDFQKIGSSTRMLPTRDDAEWAFSFSGTQGLRSLEKLEKDASLTSAGRERATRIRAFILDKKLFTSLDIRISSPESVTGPVKRSYFKYLRKQDEKYFQNLGEEIPETPYYWHGLEDI